MRSTVASTTRRGLLLAAGAGTVFLDEIGNLSLLGQAQLLRVIEQRMVRPVGSNQHYPLRARIVLATNRDLDEAVELGTFRGDLLERIRGFLLVVPPLRERRADIPLLTQLFVDQYNKEYGGCRTVDTAAVDELFGYDWPGNVRELRHAIRKAAAYSSTPDGPVSAICLHEAVQRKNRTTARYQVGFDPTSDTWHEFLARARDVYLRAVLAQARGNKDEAVRRAGISRARFYELLKEAAGQDEPRG